MVELLSVAARDVKALNPATRDLAHIIGATLESLSLTGP